MIAIASGEDLNDIVSHCRKTGATIGSRMAPQRRVIFQSTLKDDFIETPLYRFMPIYKILLGVFSIVVEEEAEFEVSRALKHMIGRAALSFSEERVEVRI